MGLTLLHGLNGSGKTYHAVKDFLIPALKAGRNVITNIDGIDTEYLHIAFGISYENLEKLVLYPPGEDLSQAGGFDDPMTRFYEICQKQKNTLVLFDEIQTYYPAMAWKENPYRNAFTAYVTQHRKYGDDLVALTPDASKVDSAIRNIFHYNIHFKKAGLIGQNDRYFYNVRYASEFDSKPLKTGTGKYEPEYYAAYKSFRADKEGETKMSSFRFAPKSLLVVAFLALLGLLYSLYKAKQNRDSAVPAPSTVSAPGPELEGRLNPGKHASGPIPGLGGYYQRSPTSWVLLGCDGETIGFSSDDPSDDGQTWASCTSTESVNDSSESSSPKFGAL